MKHPGITSRTVLLMAAAVGLMAAVAVAGSWQKPADLLIGLREVFFVQQPDSALGSVLDDAAALLVFWVWLGCAVVVARTGRREGRKKLPSLVVLPVLTMAAVAYVTDQTGGPGRMYPGAVVALTGAVLYELGYLFNCTLLAVSAGTFALCSVYGWLAGATSAEAIAAACVMAAVQYIWLDVELRYSGFTYPWKCRNS